MSCVARWAFIENIATLIITAVTVLGLYWMGAGAWSFWGLVILLNVNTVKMTKDDKP